MSFSFRKRLQSFVHAMRGARTLLRTQHNAWLHTVATVSALSLGFVLRISSIDWALVVIAIALVWIAEALNTAVEFLADEVTRDWRDGIGKAKDVAAFGVLVSAIAAVAIGLIVFVPLLA